MEEERKVKILEYNKYLDRTVVFIVVAVIFLVGILFLIWKFYLPNKEKKAVKINYFDNRDPSKPNTSLASQGNLQSQSSPPVVFKVNDPYGNYQKAQLKQFCSQTDTSNAINLPQDFSYQECDTGLKCTSGILKENSICLADIGSACNNLSDCVPGANACLNGECSLVDTVNKINTPCKFNSDCQLNENEDQINNHICYKLPGEITGLCKVDLFPFDGGCQNDIDCNISNSFTKSLNSEIRCINSNNFKDTIFGASLISQDPGVSMKIEILEKFNLNPLIEENFMVYVLNSIEEISDSSQQYPFTISDISQSKLTLKAPEFPQNIPIPSFNTGLSIYFGTYPKGSFIGSNITTGGPYGICMELLPVGSPANLKLANVTIPGVSLVPTTVLDNRIVKQSRLGPGIIGDFCFTKPNSSPILGCEKGLNCNYNYLKEEQLLDNFYYTLLPDNFDLQYVGNCMIRNTIRDRPCNNTTLGCSPPNICLPILNPVTNEAVNYCVPPMRSQLCLNNICPTNYSCLGTSCLSNKNNLAFSNSDCFSNSVSSSIDLFVYNKDTREYYRLNLNLNGLAGSGDIPSPENITFKFSNGYEIVDSYPEIGLNGKSNLPSRILCYGPIELGERINFQVYSLQNNKYTLYSNSFIYSSPGATIHDINLIDDNTISVVEKKTLNTLRELAFTINSIETVDGKTRIYLTVPTNWISFNMFQFGKTYDFYTYCPTDSTYNIKNTATVGFDTSSIYYDYFELSSDLNLNKTFDGSTICYLVIDSNQFSFNNNYYFQKILENTNYNFPNNISSVAALPMNFDFGEKNLYETFENFFMLPIVYRNINTVLNPNYQKNSTFLENGDRINIQDDFILRNVKNFNPDNEEVPPINILKGTYLYIEKVQQNSYYNNSENQYVNLDNYICNLHSDFLSSQGFVPIFNEATYNQNFGANSENTFSPVNFTVYEDMVNYSINFVKLTEGNAEIVLNTAEKFIGTSLYEDSSLTGDSVPFYFKNHLSYSFEEDTEVSFNFENPNEVLISSVIEGVSRYHTYVNKLEYQFTTKTYNDEITTKDLILSKDDEYEYYYQNTYLLRNPNSVNYLTNLKIKYVNQFVAPGPKSLYFDSSTKANLIDTVQENVIGTDTNKISIFTTFNNDNFISESGDKNVFSNKSPPIASYSTLNDFNLNLNNQEINYNFINEKNDQYSYVELNDSISLNYTLENNCLGDSTGEPNTITLRDPEIIDMFLNNPASEIILQKQGDSFQDFYYNSVKEGLSVAGKKLQPNPYNINLNDVFIADNNPENFSSKNIEINRGAVSIKEYNIYLGINGDIKEYLVITLNAPIDNTDLYVKNCFNNSSKWKFWHNNYAPLNYFNDYEYNFIYNDDIEKLTFNYSDRGAQDLITIMDGSVLWTSTKIEQSQLPPNYKTSSYNKILVTGDNDYDILNVHDGYFFKKELTNRNGFHPSLTSPLNTSFQYFPLHELPLSEADSGKGFFETPLNISSISNTIISLPGESNLPDLLTLPNLTTNFFSQAGVSTGTTIKSIFLDSSLKPTKWYLSYTYNGNAEEFLNPISSLDNLFSTKSLPKKITTFDINNNLYNLFLPYRSDNNKYFGEYPLDDNFPNNSFTYFKRKSQEPILYSQFTDDNEINLNYSTFNVVDLIGNNVNDLCYSVDNYSSFNSTSSETNYYLPQIETLDLNVDFFVTKLDEYGQNAGVAMGGFTCLRLVYKQKNKSGLFYKNVFLFWKEEADENLTFNNDFSNRPKPNDTSSSNQRNRNRISFSTNIILNFDEIEYDPEASLSYTSYNANGDPFSTTSTGIGIVMIWANYGLGGLHRQISNGVTNSSATNVSIDFTFNYLNNDFQVFFVFPLSPSKPVSNDYSVNLTSVNTRSSTNSFRLKPEIYNKYINTYTPITMDINSNTINMVSQVEDGYYDMMFYNNNFLKTAIGKLKIEPFNKGTICLPNQYKNYNNNLYIINNLFLSTLNTKNILNVNYIGSNLIQDFIIANKYYTNFADVNNKTTKYKGLGNIKFKITSAPIILKDQEESNNYNLVNFQEVRFPPFFTERFVSRINSIPAIKNIFTSIKQGNVFGNLNYYAYLNYETEESNISNNQILFMSTDIDEASVLENTGIPYTMSLTNGVISVSELKNIVKFEPYNKFLFTLGNYCN